MPRILDRWLEPDWRAAFKMWSIQLGLLSAAASGLYAALPAFQNYLPPIWYAVIMAGGSVLACGLRLLDQKLGDGDGPAQ